MKHFNEILSTVGAIENETTVLKESTDWEFWKAVFRTPIKNVEGYYLYLKSKCPIREASEENIKEWRRLSKNGNGYEIIVTTNSVLSQKQNHTKNEFNGTSIRTTRQFLIDNFLLDLDMDIRAFSEEEYFIDPDIKDEKNEKFKNATDYLIDWIKESLSREEEPSLGILLAPGGVGKTTLARVLCNRLRKNNPSVFPILIESEQWRNLFGTKKVTLDSILNEAIEKRFEKSAKLFSNKTALRVLINEGIFVIIFDGFDELCVHPNWAIPPKDIISGLLDYLISDDGYGQAKVLLTARNTFWESINDEIEDSRFVLFRLNGFNNNQRKRYFEVRLQDSIERDTALRISKQISGGIYEELPREDEHENRLSGMPFMLDLIARYVHDNNDIPQNPYQADPFSELLRDICKRENKRQTLEIDPNKQLELFEELFRENPFSFSIKELSEYLDVICNVVDSSVIQRFTNHVFLERIDKDIYNARYEVLRVYFLARFLAKSLSETIGKSNRNSIARLLAANCTGKTQVIDWLLNQLRQFEEEKLLVAIHHAIDIVAEETDKGIYRSSSMALAHIALRLIIDSDKIARRNKLARLFKAVILEDKIEFRGRLFTGQLRGFDFSKCVFQKCCFIDIEFKNCLFSNNSVFQNCEFEGTLDFISSDNINEIVIRSSRYSKEAEYVLSKILQIPAKEEVKRAFAEDALARAIKKFKGDWGFDNIQKRHILSGMKKGNPFNERIWYELISSGIVEEHHISGVTEGGLNIVEDKDVRREITGFLDNGVTGKKLRKVIEDTIK